MPAVAVGEHDRLLPPRRLAPQVHRGMHLDVRVLTGVGHLTTAADLGKVISVVAEVADPSGG